MSNQSKKQSLLGQVNPQQKKRQSSQKKKRLSPQQQRAAIAQAQLAQTQLNNPPKQKGIKRWITLSVIALLIIVFPKPQLITYEKLGVVATSVYWSALPGLDPVIFDSSLHPRPALDKNTLYLCMNKLDPDTCQKYQIIKKEGFFSALKALISN
ncbi:hypothetical protein CWB73_14440 [Pseudoalteromonas phenolica]|uniref:Uncharacterized protein n=1 Tax=Pseudoalteromonas phenolica TaxID=161398 RepID=A0A5S3YR38_9GAMM|nr:hypothetical protein [Pseudoalteromonas phenolica]TMP79309.1 hypothetical protein CWB73_14440 [Pseudoalteromonas phenolica]